MLTRRSVFGGAILPLAAAAAPAEVARVRVTGLETFRVKVNRRGDWVLARVQTSAGVSGLGDASHGGADDRVIALLGAFFERVKGRGIFEIERLRAEAQEEIARQGRAAAVALSALEQALWDIQGKLAGVPACALFGGRLRERVRNYANINRSTEVREPAAFARNAELAVKAGFDAIKMAPFDGMPRMDAEPARIEEFTRLGVDCVRAVRDVIGPSRDLLVDVHSHMNLERGLDLARRLEPLNLFWLEEVTPARPLENLAAINRAARMPTAGGESIYGVKGFYPYIAAGAVDIVMPDVKYCGGMLELKKIAALAEGAGLQVAPHGPASPVGNMAAAHVSVTLPNFQILEYSFGEVPWRAELIDPPEQLRGGVLEVAEKPGLGIALNEKTARKYAA